MSLVNILKDNLLSHKNIYKLVVIPIIIGLCSFATYYKSSYYFLPLNSVKEYKQYNLTKFSDKIVGGFSEIKILKKDKNLLSFEYTLHNKHQFPYAGITYFNADSSLFNFKDYDYFKMVIKSKSGTRIPITFSEHVPTYNSEGRPFKNRNVTHVFNCTQNYTEVSANLKDFKTPDWWYALNNTKESEFKIPNFEMINDVIIGNCQNIDHGIKDIVKIKEISLHVNYLQHIWKTIVPLFLYFGILGFLHFKNKSQNNNIQTVSTTAPELKIQYDKTEIVNYADKEEAAIFNYISENFRNQELTIIDIQNETGISERKISGIIKNKTNLNFKQLLNKIRLTEAKRLLTESDLPISEIADLVGYGNTTHFNRVFKMTEECSPNEYRKKHSNNQNYEDLQ